MQFLQALSTLPFLQRALAAAALSAIACGILGAYVVARRSSYMVGAMSHSLLGGIGLARYCQVVLGFSFFTPMLGAVLTTLLVSIAITLLAVKKRIREDTMLSAAWTVGVAIGLCFIAAIPGYAEDLNGYLFGNILLLSPEDLWLMLVLVAAIVPLTWLFHHRFVALCFHEESLALRGLSPARTALLLNILTGLTVVLLAQTVGLVMVLALLVLPAAAAMRLVKTLPRIMLLGTLFCFTASFLGMGLSYTYNWPTGAIIILLSAAIYLLACLASLLKIRFR